MLILAVIMALQRILHYGDFDPIVNFKLWFCLYGDFDFMVIWAVW